MSTQRTAGSLAGLNAGELRHRVEIWHDSGAGTPDSLGQTAKEPLKLATIWARVNPLHGRELERARQIVAEATHEVTIRYYAGLTAAHWFVFGGRRLNIEAVIDPDELHVKMVCLCREPRPGG